MPKKKIGKHLQFYMDCMKLEARMPYLLSSYQGGLCSMAECNLISKKLFVLFSEDQESYSYWADGQTTKIHDCFDRRSQFTELRQTIVLFMAAINNEL